MKILRIEIPQEFRAQLYSDDFDPLRLLYVYVTVRPFLRKPRTVKYFVREDQSFSHRRKGEVLSAIWEEYISTQNSLKKVKATISPRMKLGKVRRSYIFIYRYADFDERIEITVRDCTSRGEAIEYFIKHIYGDHLKIGAGLSGLKGCVGEHGGSIDYINKVFRGDIIVLAIKDCTILDNYRKRTFEQ